YAISKNKAAARHVTTISLVIIGISTALTINAAAGLIKEGRCSSEGSVAQSIGFLDANADPNDAVVSNAWPWFGYYNNLEAYSLWTSNIERYRQYNARYAVVHDTIGEPFDHTLLEKQGARLQKTITACDGTARIYLID
ncbi:hypothetical protein KY363_04175, partial [Candidatus Woesearchaeota archaeon]|nr:hypothetical protein [Candidatus Woesearchaeota archaeon]